MKKRSELAPMDLIFVTNGGDEFKIEVGYFDTVLEIKGKIEKYKGIPISDQTLKFNGEILADDLNVHDSDIIDQSRIHLFDVRPVVTEVIVQHKQYPVAAEKTEIKVKLPASSDPVEIKVSANKTIRELKGLITLRFQEMERYRVRQTVIKNENGVELADDKTVREYQNSVVTVEIRPPLPEMKLLLKMPGSELMPVLISEEGTIYQLKEIIHKSEGTPIDRIVIRRPNGNELSDHITLIDWGITAHSQLTVEFMPTSSPPPPQQGLGSIDLRPVRTSEDEDEPAA